jgi:3-deoxy-D-arabino-heptulosonate 7-phosphate (DAHP) synthase class II
MKETPNPKETITDDIKSVVAHLQKQRSDIVTHGHPMQPGTEVDFTRNVTTRKWSAVLLEWAGFVAIAVTIGAVVFYAYCSIR